MASLSLALAGIISALVFGAPTGFLWDRFRAKKLKEARKGSPVLLLSFILGGITWAYFAALFLLAVVINGKIPALQPEFWWSEPLAMLVVFLGLLGFVFANFAWRKTRKGESGFKWGVAGGVMMALTSFMLLPGALAIIGGVLKERKPVSEPSTTANVRKLNCYMPRVGIFFIAVVLLIMVALIAGMVVSSGPPSQNLKYGLGMT